MPSDPLITLGLEAVADGADPKLVRDLMEPGKQNGRRIKGHAKSGNQRAGIRLLSGL